MDHRDGLTSDEETQLRNARTEAEWNATCSAVKRARGGQYPDDWYGRVVLSGLAGRKAAEFGRT